MSDGSLRRRLTEEPDFALGAMIVSPSTGRVFAGGEEIRVEALTMAVLVTLERAGGSTVSRDALIEACWQGRIVSDDAVARAIAKVRALERCMTPPAFTVETLPKIGYRLLCDAKAELPADRAAKGAPKPAPFRMAWNSREVRLLAAGAAASVVVVGVAVMATPPRPAAEASPAAMKIEGMRSADFADAVLSLDEARLRLYLRRGWDPNWKLDSEGNAALHILMEVCERNPTHDHGGVARVARVLVEAGANPTARNKWNDTPLTIAATPRYCGPDHPVVAYLKTAIAEQGARGAL